MTTLMPSKSAERERLMARGNKAPPPAAGRPASNPPPGGSAGSSGSSGPTSQMRGKALSVDDEGDEGRTQIRAPLAGRMLVPNSKIHPSDDEDERTVGLIAGGDAHPADAPDPTRAMAGAPSPSVRPAAGEPSVEVAFQGPAPAQSHPLMLQQNHGMQQTHGMQQHPGMMRPQQQQQQLAYAPTMQAQQPMVAHLSGAYPHQHGMPAPAMSQPAHFAVPQMAHSDTRMDPPATVLTQNTSRGSRTMSWAAALMAVGVFVGLVAAVVAGGGSDGLADTSASFVDPSRPGKHVGAPDPNAAQPTGQPALPTMTLPPQQQQQPFAQVPPNGQSVFPQVGGPNMNPMNPPPQPPQPGMNPPDPTAVGMGAPLTNGGINTGTSPTGMQPGTAIQAPQPGQPAQPAQPAAAQPAPVAVAAADPPPKPRQAPRAQPRPQPQAQPAAAANNDDDKPVAAAPPPKPAKPAPAAKPAKGGGGGEDDELKKAADALSKAQLENSL